MVLPFFACTRAPLRVGFCLQVRDKGVGIDVPGRRSVFGGGSDQEEEGGDEGGGDDGDHVGTNNNANTDGPNNGDAAPSKVEADATAAAAITITTDASAATVASQGASTEDTSSNSSSSPTTAATKEEAPTFFAEKGNGYACVTSALRRRGWQVKAVGTSKGLSRQAVPGNHKSQKAEQQASASLQWVHATSSIDFDAHAGKAAAAAPAEAPPKSVQLVNHIPNTASVLTSKEGLLSTLKSHYGGDFPPPWFPETHSISSSADMEQLLARNQELSAATSASPDEPTWMIKSKSSCSSNSNGTRSGANKSVNFRSEGVQLVRGADALKVAMTTALSGATKDHVETMAPLRSDIHHMPDSLPALDTMTGASAVISTIKEETEEEEPTAAAADTSSPLGTPVRGSAVAAVRKLAATSPPTGVDDSQITTIATAVANAAYAAQLESAAAEEGRGRDSAQLSTAPLPSTMIVQRYVSNSLLLLVEGFKFDLRVFFLVARCGPGTFQCMVYNRGFTRRALEPYVTKSG